MLAEEVMSFTKCVKCSKEGQHCSTENKQAVYCDGCFIQMVQHKFSYSLGKYHIFKKVTPDDAMIVFAGDENSALLLSLICRGLSVTSSKKLRIKPSLLFMFSETDVPLIELRAEKLRELMSQYQSQGWTLHFIHMAAVLLPDADLKSDNIIGIDKIEEFQSIILDIKDKSLRQEVFRLLRNILFVRFARIHRCGHVVLPDNAEKLANDSFNALCFGRGSAICELTNVMDSPLDDVQFIRPLRDISDKEVHIYHELHPLSSYFVLNRGTYTAKQASTDSDIECGGIQRQNADFIYSLKNCGFPATVPTILSTASKVKPSSQLSYGNSSICDLAQSDAANSERWRKCEVCFTAIIPTQNDVADTMRTYVSESEFNTCRPCAVIFDELASVNASSGNICGKLIKIIKSVG